MSPKRTCLTLSPLSPFDFVQTALSHGWVGLAPNRWDPQRRAIERAERLASGKVVLLRITAARSAARPRMAIRADHQGTLSADERCAIRAAVGRMVRADEDLSEFYALCSAHGGPWAALCRGAGRLLRSPTVFEDVVKTICTTNVQWAGTQGMVRQLVEAHGEPFPDDPRLRAFPEPATIAAQSPRALAADARLGYRAEYVHALARRVASGRLDLDALRDRALPTPELKRELLEIKGVGEYAAATLLMLLGRYDEVAVDTAFRKFVRQKYFGGEQVSDRKARAIYEGWGGWKYLACWFDGRSFYMESVPEATGQGHG